MILRSWTGPAHRDPSEDVEIDEDDQRDFEDYNYQPQEEDEDSDLRLQRLGIHCWWTGICSAFYPDALCQGAWLWIVLEGSHGDTHVQVYESC